VDISCQYGTGLVASNLGNGWRRRNDTPPFHGRLLKVDEQAYRHVRCAQVIQALGHVFACQALGAFQLNHERVFDQDIRKVFAHAPALVDDWERRLCHGPDAAQPEFEQQGAFINLLEEASPQGVGDFEDRAKDALSQGNGKRLFGGILQH
jgi:hypothetical protein